MLTFILKKINFFLKIILFLALTSINLISDEINENTSILLKVKELGKFNEPKNYPEGMQNFFKKGCTGFSCNADHLTQEMLSRFNRKGKYLEKNPETQLHAMAMYEVFYQKKLKDNEKKINEFIETINSDKKNKKDIVSLIKLNEARKKMRSSLGMDLNVSTEQAMENYWIMGDFVSKGEKKENKISKEINSRKKILEKYKGTVANLKTSLTKKDEEEFYNKILDKKSKNLGDFFVKTPVEKFEKDLSKILRKLDSLPESKTTIAKDLDKSIKANNQLVRFISEKISKNDISSGKMAINLLNQNLSAIQNNVPKLISNDLSKVDVNNLAQDSANKISNLTNGIKEKKNENFNLLINEMVEINKQGLNSFKLNRELKQLGVNVIKHKDILNFIKNKNDKKKSSIKTKNVVEDRVKFTTNLMKNLGYKKEMINKEVEIIRSQGMEKKISQDILTAREMIISGASDEEIQDEIDEWDKIDISALQKDAYLMALRSRANGIKANEVKKNIQMINAVETYRQVDELLNQVEGQISKSSVSKSIPQDKDLEEDVLFFAQVAGANFTNNFFSSDKQLSYDKFLEEQKNKQIEVFQQQYKVSEIYEEINTPLTVISVIVSPTPFNVVKLARIAKQQADEKKARVLAAASFGTGEDELGAGDYIDPRIFERTAKVLNTIQVNNIQSKNLAKKLNYSISLISLEASKNEIQEQSNDTISDIKNETKQTKDQIPKGICVDQDCFISKPPIEEPRPINPLLPIDIFIQKAEKVKKVELVRSFQNMIKDKNVSILEISNRTLSNSKVIDMQLYLEEIGVADAADKVSKAYAEVGLSKTGMPSIFAINDPSFNIAAHLEAMETVASEAGLQSEIASASQAAADVQDAINAASGEISAELAQANADAQQALADAQRALDMSRSDTGYLGGAVDPNPPDNPGLGQCQGGC